MSDTTDRPNILLITTDQQRHDHLGIAGTPGVSTPHLDRLARAGFCSDRAYTPSPLCTPCRVSLLTGQYPSRHGAYSIGVTTSPHPPATLPLAMADAGYRTALFGKHHFVARRDEERDIHPGNDHDFYRRTDHPYRGFQEFAGSCGHTLNTVPAQHYKAWLEQRGVDYAKWFPLLSDRDRYDHHRCGPWSIPAEHHDTEWVGGLTEEFIERCSADGSPWFCWASFQDPHEPFVCPEPWYSQIDPESVRLYEGYRDGQFDDRHPLYQATYEGRLDPWNDGNGVPCLQGRGAYAGRERDALRATLGMIAFIDHQVGRLVARLEQCGQLENTLIIFTSDHGEMHGHHGLWGKGAAAFEDCQRVPFIAHWPRGIPATGKSNNIVNLIDLPRTFLASAGIHPTQGMQGVNLIPMLTGSGPEAREETFIECRPTPHLNQLTMVTQSWKLVLYSDSPDGELYHLADDPNQTRNLWHDPQAAAQREGLLRRAARRDLLEPQAVHPRVAFG